MRGPHWGLLVQGGDSMDQRTEQARLESSYCMLAN